MEHVKTQTVNTGPWTTYKPLILVALFIVGVTMLVELNAGDFTPMRAMNTFMAGFFIFFSFFKFLNLNAFADAFSTYDILAKRSRTYALAFPFVELALGVAFALNLYPVAANIITVVLMAVGSYGVWLVLKRKGTIQCACLGTIFNLPMTKITLFENGLMMVMALASLALHRS
ncbi:MAG: hypothetical protein KF799_09515 [Bdellovibrionales bacterium]|nr:hypothetical protein [Bdellovibrionales bacterium]